MTDHFWETQDDQSHQVRCEGGEVVQVFPRAVGAIAAEAGNFVWDPGQPRHDNVFPSWTGADGLYNALKALQGQKWVTCNTFTADPEIPTGSWPGVTDVTFLAGAGTPIQAQILVDAGAKLPDLRNLKLDGVILSVAGANVIDLAGGVCDIVLRNASEITGAGNLVRAGGASVLSSVCTEGSKWDAGQIVMAGTAVAAVEVFNASVLAANTFSGAGGTTVEVLYDVTSAENVFQTQGAGPTYVFVPSDLANTTQATGNTGTGSGTVTVTTGNITPVWSGKVHVNGSCLFAASAAATITAQLVRDAGTGGAANIGNAKTIVLTGAAQALEVSLDFIDTTTDNAAHTYQYKLTASAGTLTVTANGAQITAQEVV